MSWGVKGLTAFIDCSEKKIHKKILHLKTKNFLINLYLKKCYIIIGPLQAWQPGHVTSTHP